MTAKTKNMLKALMLSVLAISIFSTGFVLLNSAVFSAALENVEPADSSSEVLGNDDEHPLRIANDVLNVNFTVPDEPIRFGSFSPPNIYVVEMPAKMTSADETSADEEKPTGVLSAEEAALIGAEYLWDMFGADLDGMTFEMRYTQFDLYTRDYWMGNVIKLDEIGQNMRDYNYTFALDALTGERVEIWHFRMCDWISPEVNVLLSNLAVHDPETLERLWEETGRLPLSVDAVIPVENLGRIVAQRHFNNTELVQVYLPRSDVNNSYAVWDIIFEINAAGDLVAAPRSFNVIAVDDTGREISITLAVHESTLVLEGISSKFNDFVPGVHQVGDP